MQKITRNPWKLCQTFQVTRIECGHFQIIDSCKHCQKLQGKWYAKLKKKKFKDIEDPVLRLIKKWTGISDLIEDDGSERNISLIDIIISQEPNTSIESSWPETNFRKEQELLNNSNLYDICKKIFKHKRNVVGAEDSIKILEYHCSGIPYRHIAKQVHIHEASVLRAINKLKEMAHLMSDDSKTIIIRDYNPGMDAPLLFSSWRNCLWFDAHPAETKPNPIFFRQTTKKINNLLRDPHTKVRIACLQDDPNEIKGYATINNDTIEFVYVKLDYRKQGIATLLTKGFKSISDPCTKIASAIALKKNLKTKEKQNVRTEAEEEYNCN